MSIAMMVSIAAWNEFLDRFNPNYKIKLNSFKGYYLVKHTNGCEITITNYKTEFEMIIYLTQHVKVVIED